MTFLVKVRTMRANVFFMSQFINFSDLGWNLTLEFIELS